MKYIDTHVHIGDYDKIKIIIETSQYRTQYRLYSAIDPESIRQADDYLEQCESFIAMPIVLKELSVREENEFVLNYCRNNRKAIPMLLVGDNPKRYERNKIRFLKEHFLYHDSSQWEERRDAYEYLNLIHGFLLIHSADTIRIPYIKDLRAMFPNMNIIIAHMGRNVWENYDFTILVIEAFKDDSKIWFDISTITDLKILEYAIKVIGSKRLLYASDFPYEFKCGMTVQTFAQKINSMNISDEEKNNIFYQNATKILADI